ncbi:MAG: CheR family methyltransferase [Geminicoccales bacterium]
MTIELNVTQRARIMPEHQGSRPNEHSLFDEAAEPPSQRPLRVVAIGAGTGSLEAIQLFFAAMPARRNLAFIICRQTYSEITDHVSALLRHETTMPVHQVEDGVRLEGNAIYLLPPNARMALVQDRLVSFDQDEDGLSVAPLDLLFHALAASQGAEAIALLLSGEGEEGLRGAVSIQRTGGLVLAQDPSSADFPDRLKAVIDAGLVAAHCAPEAMPGLIGRFIDSGKIEDDDALAAPADQVAFNKIFQHLSDHFDLDLDAYRRPMVARRIRRRAALANTDDLEHYATCLLLDDQEAEQLHDDIMIGITAFFRDPEAFALLASKVVPILVERSSHDRPIKIWVPACATGEEAYSLAMLIADHLSETGLDRRVEIKATDRHRRSLDAARLGHYSPEQILNLPAHLLKRYMEPLGEQLSVRDAIRDMVIFAEHDLVQEPPLSGMDLVSCRNLLIYLAQNARERALSACSEALNAQGFLFLGPSELPGSSTEGLSVIDRRWRIYQRMATLPNNAAILRLPDVYQKRPVETIQVPEEDPRPIPSRPPLTPLDDDDHPSLFESMIDQNQQMLESTIDTLLASNDALRRRNRDLRLENQRLTTANTALEDIATLVAHDLKAPLREVDHLARRLEAGWREASERQRGEDDLRHLQLRLVGLHRLIDDLLTYARQETDGQSRVEQVDLGGLIREVLALIGLPPGFRIEVRPPELIVRTQRIPLECIFRNVLGNAIQHHGGQKGYLKIDVQCSDNALDVRLDDDGQGLVGPREGLGLAIVRQLLAAENCHLALTPKVEGGTVARFTWPIDATGHQTQ